MLHTTLILALLAAARSQHVSLRTVNPTADTATFVCTLDGAAPRSQVSWWRGQLEEGLRPVDISGGRISVPRVGSLVIRRLRTQDEDLYTCCVDTDLTALCSSAKPLNGEPMHG